MSIGCREIPEELHFRHYGTSSVHCLLGLATATAESVPVDRHNLLLSHSVQIQHFEDNDTLWGTLCLEAANRTQVRTCKSRCAHTLSVRYGALEMTAIIIIIITSGTRS